MRAALLAIFTIAMLAVPKLWHNIKGADFHLFSKHVFEIVQGNDFPPEMACALDQPFHYWAKGSQFYVYLSDDGNYVLKIPRASKMRESLLDRFANRKIRKPDVFVSMQIARDCLMLQTALFYVHLEKTLKDFFPVKLYDRIHRSQRVNLSSVPFVLQKRHTLMSTALLEAKEVNEAKKILLAYLDLILFEKSQGVMSHDCAFWLNFGFNDGQAFRLDVGSYVPIDRGFSLKHIAKPVIHWLKEHSELANWFEQEIERREKA